MSRGEVSYTRQKVVLISGSLEKINKKITNKKTKKNNLRSKNHGKSCQNQKFEKLHANRIGIFKFGPPNKKVFLPTLVKPRLGIPRPG